MHPRHLNAARLSLSVDNNYLLSFYERQLQQDVKLTLNGCICSPFKGLNLCFNFTHNNARMQEILSGELLFASDGRFFGVISNYAQFKNENNSFFALLKICINITLWRRKARRSPRHLRAPQNRSSFSSQKCPTKQGRSEMLKCKCSNKSKSA